MSSPRKSRWIVWGVGLSATGGGVVLAALLAAHLHREAPHPPVFDEERDLLPLPPPRDNGWFTIAAHPRSFFEPLPPFAELLQVDSGPPRLAEWRAMRDELERWEFSAAARAELVAALAQPRFVIVCEALDGCEPLSWLSAHRFAAALALREATRGADDDALTLAEDLLRADLDALVNARTLVGAMTAQTLAAEAIELVSLLAAVVGERESGALSASLSARLDALVRTLDALEPERWSLEHALIGESIGMRRALDSVEAPTAGWRWGAPDFARAARLLDDHMEASLRYARAPDAAPPPEPPEAGLLWRALDPVGPQLLEVLQLNTVPIIDDFAHDAAQAAERIAVAKEALVAARARVDASAAP